MAKQAKFGLSDASALEEVRAQLLLHSDHKTNLGVIQSNYGLLQLVLKANQVTSIVADDEVTLLFCVVLSCFALSLAYPSITTDSLTITALMTQHSHPSI